MVVWRRWTGSGHQVQASGGAASGRWSAPVALSAPSGDAWGPQVAVGPDGTAVATWSHADGAEYRIQASRRAADGSWSTAAVLSDAGMDAWDPQVAVGDGGAATVVWRRWVGDHDRIAVASSTRSGVWTEAELLSTTGGDAHDAQVAVDPGGVVTVTWSRWDGSVDRVQAASLPPGGVWSAPETLSRPSVDALAPQISSGPDGRATVVWHVLDGVDAQVEATTRRADGVWPGPTNVSGAGERAGGPQVATGPDGTVAVVSRSGARAPSTGCRAPSSPRSGNGEVLRMAGADREPTALSRRSFLGMAAGFAGAVGMGGVAQAGWLGASGTDPARDPDLLPGDAAHAWLWSVYQVVWHEGNTPTNAARIYGYLAATMYEAVAPASSTLRSLAGQLTGLAPLPQSPPARTDPPCVLAAAVRSVTDHVFRAASGPPSHGVPGFGLRTPGTKRRRDAGCPPAS